MLVTSNDVVKVVSKEIRRHEDVSEAKDNYGKLAVLWLGSWKVCALPDAFSWIDGVLFDPDLQLKKIWSEELKKILASASVRSRKRLSLKSMTGVSDSLILYQLFGLSHPCTVLVKIEIAVPVCLWQTGSFDTLLPLSFRRQPS